MWFGEMCGYDSNASFDNFSVEFYYLLLHPLHAPMSRIEELPYEKEKSKAGSDTAQPSAAAIPNSHTEYGPSLPPSMAAPKQTVDELVSDLKKSPFFMTSLDDVGDEYNPGVEAIRALIYEGSRGEQATNFREQGNEDAKARRWTDAREQYSKGLAALKAPRKPEDPANEDEDKKEIGLKELLLVNRALCQLELSRSCLSFILCRKVFILRRELQILYSGLHGCAWD